MDRLDADSPEVANRVRQASDSERTAFVLTACKQAVMVSALADPLANQALVKIELGRPDPALSSALSELAGRLDTRYFDAQERDDDSWRGLFQQARSAAALAQALQVVDSESAAEAIYEAAHAADDQSSVYRLIV
jgi:hypothetical protein